MSDIITQVSQGTARTSVEFVLVALWLVRPKVSLYIAQSVSTSIMLTQSDHVGNEDGSSEGTTDGDNDGRNDGIPECSDDGE